MVALWRVVCLIVITALGVYILCQREWAVAPHLHPPPATKVDARPGFALLVAITTKGLTISSIDDLPFFRILLPSLLATIDDAHRYAIYFAIDKGDPVLDNAATMAAIRDRWNHTIIPMHFHVYGNTRSRPTWGINYVEGNERPWLSRSLCSLPACLTAEVDL